MTDEDLEISEKIKEFIPIVSERLMTGINVYEFQLGTVSDDLACKVYVDGKPVAFNVFSKNPFYGEVTQTQIVVWIIETVPHLKPHLNRVQRRVQNLLSHKKRNYHKSTSRDDLISFCNKDISFTFKITISGYASE